TPWKPRPLSATQPPTGRPAASSWACVSSSNRIGAGNPPGPSSPVSLVPCLSFPEGRRLDPQRPQINIPLPAVVNLIVDRVLDRVDPAILPLAKCLIHFAEAMRRDLRKHFVQPCGLFIPDPQQISLGGHARLRYGELRPLPRSHALRDRHRHPDELPRHLRKGPHPTNRKFEKLVLRKRFDHPARQPPVSLPVLQNIARCRHAYFRSRRCHIASPLLRSELRTTMTNHI